MSARESYPHFLQITTRWKDNDVYGHVNNVEYYSYFDTVINSYLIEKGGLDFREGPAMGVCAESHCKFFTELLFPGVVEAGLCVEHIGNSSVRYGIGLFAAGQSTPAAEGWFVHVFVDRITRRPTTITPPLRVALQRLVTGVSL